MINDKCYKEIVEYLNLIKSDIELYNGFKLYDINKFAEYFYAEFLNLLFGYKFEIMEKINPNMVAIDLGDKKNKIAIQVTSKIDRGKIEDTVKKFKENNFDKVYKRLIVLHIANETPNYRNKSEKIGNIFDLEKDVWNIKYLIEKSLFVTISKQKKVRDLLKEYVDDSPNISNLDKFLKEKYKEPFFTKIKMLSSRLPAKLKKLKWSSTIITLTLRDFQYQYSEFCKKSSSKNANIQDDYQDLTIKTKKNQEDTKLEDLLKENNKALIFGKAGVGKSILSKYICYKWANEELFKEFDYLFYIPIKKWNRGEGIFDIALKTLKRLINEDIKINSETLCDYIEKSNNKILFIIDGLDELKSENDREDIIKDIQKFDNYIITSRHYGVEENELIIDETFENFGFDEKSKRKFINDTKLVNEIEKNPQLKELSRIPLFLDIICFLYQDSQIDFNNITITTLYKEAIDKIFYTLKSSDSLKYDRIKYVKGKAFRFLGKVGFKNLKQSKYQFNGDFIDDDSIGFFEDFVLEYGYLINTTNEDVITKRDYEFTHSSFQEYFTAYYISNLKNKKIRKVIKENKFKPQFNMTFQFLTGLIEDKNLIFNELYNEPRDETELYELLLLIDCISQTYDLKEKIVLDVNMKYFKWLEFATNKLLLMQKLINKLKIIGNILNKNSFDSLKKILRHKNMESSVSSIIIGESIIEELSFLKNNKKFIDLLKDIMNDEKANRKVRAYCSILLIDLGEIDEKDRIKYFRQFNYSMPTKIKSLNKNKTDNITIDNLIKNLQVAQNIQNAQQQHYDTERLAKIASLNFYAFKRFYLLENNKIFFDKFTQNLEIPVIFEAFNKDYNVLDYLFYNAIYRDKAIFIKNNKLCSIEDGKEINVEISDEEKIALRDRVKEIKNRSEI